MQLLEDLIRPQRPVSEVMGARREGTDNKSPRPSDSSKSMTTPLWYMGLTDVYSFSYGRRINTVEVRAICHINFYGCWYESIYFIGVLIDSSQALILFSYESIIMPDIFYEHLFCVVDK